MNIQRTDNNISQKAMLLLGILAGICLFGYAVNLICMPAVSPDAFVTKSVALPGGTAFGLLQLFFVLGFSFAFLPVTVMFTVKRYADNPSALVFAGSLLCLALFIEIFNNLPFLGTYVYPEPLAAIRADVQLYLNQAAAIRYLSFHVAGFTILYVSLLVYAASIGRCTGLWVT